MSLPLSKKNQEEGKNPTFRERERARRSWFVSQKGTKIHRGLPASSYARKLARGSIPETTRRRLQDMPEPPRATTGALLIKAVR